MRQSMPKLVLCAGAKSSGSTWLFNVVIAILKRRAPEPGAVLPAYADRIRRFPAEARTARYLVIKSHTPSDDLQHLVAFLRAPVFLTLREPRDGIASEMRRLRHGFERCLQELTGSAPQLAGLIHTTEPLTLRYEDRFYDDPATVGLIARSLGVRLPKAALAEIFQSLTRDAVTATIEALTEQGVFGADADPDRHDPDTHWHPGHVGDLVIGKYAAVLSPEQQEAVLAVTGEYRRAFGYDQHGGYR